jgi:hypothetical protein
MTVRVDATLNLTRSSHKKIFCLLYLSFHYLYYLHHFFLNKMIFQRSYFFVAYMPMLYA